MPTLVQERLPNITQWIVTLTSTCYAKRLKNLEKNEEYIKNGFESDSGNEMEGDSSDNMEEDEATAKMMNKLKKFQDGKPQDGDEVSDDDSEDSDYAENAGEFCLYDSPLEDTDELITIKQILE